MAKARQSDILKGDIKKALIKMALPLMFFNLINVMYSLVDTFWIGRLGELQVGAISLVSQINMCGTAFATGLSAGGMAIMAKSLGANNKDKANHTATILIRMCIILGILVGICIAIFVKPILNWLDAPIDIYNDAYLYLLGLSFDYLFMFIVSIFQAIRQSGGDSRTAVSVNIISAVFNIILDPLLIFGCHLQILGAALATTFSKVLVMPFIFRVLTKDKDFIYIDFKKYPFKFDITQEIITIGLPSSLGTLIMEFGFVLISKYIVAYDSIVMSGYAIGNRIANIFYIPTNAFGTALTPIVGQNIGAKNYKRVHDSFKTTMKLATVISIVLTSLGLVMAKPLTNLFVKNASERLIEISCQYANFNLLTMFLMVWNGSLLAMFNGAGSTKSSLVLSVTRIWFIRLPLIYLFDKYTNLQYVGIWWAMIISNFVICILSQIWYSTYYKNKYKETPALQA